MGGQPRIDRPGIPAAYGAAKATEFVEWSHVEDRLRSDRTFWIATVGPSGRPRVRPIDGVYLDGTLYVGGSAETRWVRELADNSNVSVHLDGTADVVIVEGQAEVLSGVADDLASRLADASNAKYPEYAMTPAFYRRNGAIKVSFRKVITWSDITRDPTRFRFDG
jgi:nitroimidazol reductase NimA-like FMN-containing flavoprotein (pyridoxamine 5'-phosphate oxidase superfamily)